MIIKSIEYNNFRPFFGKQKIDFSVDEDKNVIVILAKNTYGKTTIILSFIWCFYGESRFENPYEILNRALENQMGVGQRETAYVEVILEHEGTEYTIKREQEFVKCPNGQLRPEMPNFSMTYVDENGETHSCGKYSNELKEAIESIMPQDLSGYFFFEGEKSNSISTKDISQAVKKLLGLDVYKNMMDHLHGATQKVQDSSVMGSFEKNSHDENNLKAHDALIKKAQATKKLEATNNDLVEEEDQNDYFTKKIFEIEEQLRAAAPTREVQNRRDLIKRQLLQSENYLNKSYNKFFTEFSRHSFYLFLLPLLKKTQDKLELMDLDDKGISGIDIRAIEELLKRHECLCGTQLNEGSLAYKNVEFYKEILPPKSIATLVKEMVDKSNQNRFNGEGYINSFRSEYQEILYTLESISSLEREEKECLEQLRELDTVDSKKLSELLSTYKGHKSSSDKKLIQLHATKQTLELEIERQERFVSQLSSSSERAKKYKLYYHYSKEIYEWVKQTYDEKEVVIREDLQTKFQDLFNRIYSGTREARIDERYNLDVYVNGRPQALTGGLHVIKYFSFVGALVQLASETINSRNNEDIFGEHYPLVLDAAFSHADEIHTKAIAEELSNTTKQLVFAVMDKDWHYAEPGVKNKTKRVYRLHKISENETEIQLLQE